MRQHLSGTALPIYERMKTKFMKQYGEVHLCGHCEHMFNCERMRLQNIAKAEVKSKLMKRLPFVKRYEMDILTEKKDIGFIVVYECDNFEYEMF